MLNSISIDITNGVSCAKSAREVWVDIEERFSQGNGPQIHELKKSLATFEQKQMFVASYFTTFKIMWDELASYTNLQTCTYGASK